MSLTADVIMAVTVTMVAAIVVYMTGAALVPLGDEVQDQSGDKLEKFSGDEFISDTQDVLFKWGPIIGVAGTWIVVGIRHYRRQRIEAVRPRV